MQLVLIKTLAWLRQHRLHHMVRHSLHIHTHCLLRHTHHTDTIDSLRYQGMFIRGWSGRSVKLATKLHLLPRLRMLGAIILFLSVHFVSLILLSSISLTSKMAKVGYSKLPYFVPVFMLVKKYSAFTEPVGSTACSKRPTSGYYPEPDEPSQQPPANLRSFQLHPPSHA